MTRSGKPGTTLKARLHQYFLSHEVVTRSRKKTENFAFLEPVTRQFSSLPIFVDCSEVRENFVSILYAWMEAFPVCKCKSTADRTCDFTPLSERRSLEHNFAINVRLIKVAFIDCVLCPVTFFYNFMVSIKDDFHCGYFALRDER